MIVAKYIYSVISGIRVAMLYKLDKITELEDIQPFIFWKLYIVIHWASALTSMSNNEHNLVLFWFPLQPLPILKLLLIKSNGKKKSNVLNISEVTSKSQDLSISWTKLTYQPH